MLQSGDGNRQRRYDEIWSRDKGERSILGK